MAARTAPTAGARTLIRVGRYDSVSTAAVSPASRPSRGSATAMRSIAEPRSPAPTSHPGTDTRARGERDDAPRRPLPCSQDVDAAALLRFRHINHPADRQVNTNAWEALGVSAVPPGRPRLFPVEHCALPTHPGPAGERPTVSRGTTGFDGDRNTHPCGQRADKPRQGQAGITVRLHRAVRFVAPANSPRCRSTVQSNGG